jgi:hypothetical protein
MMPPVDTFDIPGVNETSRDQYSVYLEIHDNLEEVLETALPYGISDIETFPVKLEEIFLAYYGNSNGGNHG